MTNKLILDTNKDNKTLFEFLKNNKSINLNLIDKIQGFYINVSFEDDIISVPFSYILINTNKKLEGIPYINFEQICSSHKKGLCNVPEGLCYSQRDQKRLSANNFKICLNVLFFEAVLTDNNLYNKVVEFLSLHKLIRYNCNNDLKNKACINFLIKLSKDLNNSIISGYTNRYDLLEDAKALNKYNVPDNLIFNGSNYMLTNEYITTTNLKTFVESDYYCKGLCKGCLNCFICKGKKIYALLHGALSHIDKYYNTYDNRDYLINIFDTLNIKLTHEILTVNKGLLLSLNKALVSHDIKFKNYNELTLFIRQILN